MPSEILEQIREQVAYYERTHPLEDPAERREREFEQRKREEREARKTREAETASSDWHAVVDGRIHEHLKSWLWTAIDQRVTQILEQHFFSGKRGVGGAVIGGLTDAVGGIVGKLKRTIEAQQHLFETKLAEQQERHDGRIEASLARERAAIGEAQTQLREEIRHAIAELCDAFGAQLAEQKEHFLSVAGKLPVAKLWQPDSVTYEAQVVCHDGSLWQACKDTAQTPGGSDWVCVARAGRDAVTPKTCGTFNAHKTYARLDVVEFDGSSFVARRDAPGVPGISGDGWQLVSRSGRRGPAGEVGPRGRKGDKGERGEAAPTIVSWTLDRKNYRAVPTMSNGTQGAVLELRGLFELFVEETC